MKKIITLFCALCMFLNFAPSVFAEDAVSTITEVSGAVYQNTTATRDGVVWRFSDSVTGLVDTMGTSALTDDVFQEGTMVEPISYINEKGNVELSTADKETMVIGTRYDAYINASDNTHSGAMFSKENFSGDFDLETRFRYDEYLHISLYTGTNRFYVTFASDSELHYEKEDGFTRSIEVNLGHNQWHTMKFSVRNKDIGTIYIDGEEVVTYKLRAVSTSARLQYFTKHYSDSVNVTEIEYAKLTPVTSSLNITSISYGQTFTEGDSITLKTSSSSFFSRSSYYINDKQIATDSLSGNTKVSGLKAGTYDIVAKNGSNESVPVRIYVKPMEKTVNISAPETVNYGNDISLTVETANFDNISRVDYYLNGQLATSTNSVPYSASISANRVGTASVYAKVVDADGSFFCSEFKTINVIYDGAVGSLDISREYMIDYSYSDVEKSGTVKINDGFFDLNFKHSGKKITYQSTDGEQTYEILGDGDGTGEFKVVVTAGNAEVYYNGQFAFACLMPYSVKISGSFNYENVDNVILQGSGVKAERYFTEWDGREEIADYDMNFGLYYSAEFNKNDASAETLVIYDGEYQAKLMFDDRGITAVAQFEDYREQEDFNLSETIPTGYYRLTVARGIAQLFVNNTYINSFMCPAMAHGDAVLRKVSNPDSTDFVSIKNTDDVYYHSEDFEGKTELSAEEYFITDYDSFVRGEGEAAIFTHSVENLDRNNALKLWGSGDYALNANAKYPSLKWRAKADGNGVISFICRYQQKATYVGINYDFASKRWYVDDAKISKDTTTSEYVDGHTEMASVSGTLDTNWHDYEIKIDGTTVTLFCDGAVVISWDGVEPGSGRVAFGVQDNATLYVDDIEYSGEGKASPGLSVLYDREIKAKEFYKTNDGVIWTGSASSKQFKSADNGETWEETNLYTSGNSIRLLSGRYLRVGNQNSKWAKYQTYSRTFDADANWNNTNASWDRGLWGDGKNLIEPDDPYALGVYNWSTMGTRLMQVQDGPYKGRVFYARGMGGEYRGGTALFYTDGDFDDNDIIEYTFEGKMCKSFVWHPVATSFAYEDIGINNQESLVVDMPDGSLRYIARTDTGFLCYSESFDGGINWSEFKPTQLIAPRCCFGMVRDPDSLDNQYAVWEYDVNSADKQNDGGRPRCRTAFAMTSDGMANWKYIMDIHCLTENWRTSLTPNNHTLRVIDNKAYISLAGTDGAYSLIGIIDLSVSKPLLRFPGAQERIEAYTDLWDLAENYTVLSKSGERAMVNGVLYENVGENGRFAPEIMGEVLGTNVSISGSEAKFTLGKASFAVSVDSNGLVDVKACADAFGKVITETEDAYIVSSNPIAQPNLNQLGGMGTERSMYADNVATLLQRINQAAMFGNVENIKYLIETYGNEIGVSADLSGVEDFDAVYGRMTGYKYYSTEDVNETLALATDAQKNAEKSENNLAMSTVSGGMDNWILQGDSIDVSASTADGIATVAKSKTYGDAELGTLKFDVPDCEEYYVTFKAKVDSGKADIQWGNDAHRIKLELDTVAPSEFGVQKEIVPMNVTSGLWYDFKIIVTESESGKTVQIMSSDSGEAVTFENVSGTSGKKGFWMTVPHGISGSAQIKDVRIYHGKAYDVLELSVKDGKASVSVDFLNDGTLFQGGQLILAVYNGNKFAGAGSSIVITEEVAPFVVKGIQISEFDYCIADGLVPTAKLLMWEDLNSLKPILTSVAVQ